MVKINVFKDGEYLFSTTKYDTLKSAIKSVKDGSANGYLIVTGKGLFDINKKKLTAEYKEEVK